MPLMPWWGWLLVGLGVLALAAIGIVWGSGMESRAEEGELPAPQPEKQKKTA